MAWKSFIADPAELAAAARVLQAATQRLNDHHPF